MKFSQISKLLEVVDPKLSIMLQGTHGIGKTEFVKAWAKQKGLKLVVWHASHAADAGDITGLPYLFEWTTEDENGVKQVERTTKFAPPAWMINNEPVCLLLDEINRGLSVALNAVMQLTNDQTYDSMTLPEGSRIIACINPEKDGTYDVGRMDDAQLDRFGIYEVTSDPEEWCKWAAEHDVDERIIRYITQFPSNLCPYDNKELVKTTNGSAGIHVLPSPRSWVHLDKTIKEGEKTGAFEGAEGVKFLVDVASGIVGASIALDFKRFFMEKSTLNPKEMLSAKTFKKEWTKKLMELSKTDTPDAIKFMKGVELHMKQVEPELVKSKASDKVMLKTYADNFLSIMESLTPEVQISVVNDIVLTASANGDRWVSIIQSVDKSYKKKFDDLYTKATLEDDV